MFDVMSKPNCTRNATNYPAIIRDPKQGKIVQETVCLCSKVQHGAGQKREKVFHSRSSNTFLPKEVGQR